MLSLLVESRYFPAVQSRQVDAANISEYFPSSHAVQSAEDALPSVFRYLPNVQLWQTAMDVDPGIVEYFPSTHNLQSVDSLVLPLLTV